MNSPRISPSMKTAHAICRINISTFGNPISQHVIFRSQAAIHTFSRSRALQRKKLTGHLTSLCSSASCSGVVATAKHRTTDQRESQSGILKSVLPSIYVFVQSLDCKTTIRDLLPDPAMSCHAMFYRQDITQVPKKRYQGTV